MTYKEPIAPVVPDTMRQTYRELSDWEKRQMAEVKKRGADFLEYIGTIDNQGRETALAKTKIEEAVMWAVKGITG